MGWCLNDHEPSESVKSGEVFLNVFRTTRFVAQRVNLDWATLSGVSVVPCICTLIIKIKDWCIEFCLNI